MSPIASRLRVSFGAWQLFFFIAGLGGYGYAGYAFACGRNFEASIASIIAGPFSIALILSVIARAERFRKGRLTPTKQSGNQERPAV